jgi:hypothetical protein
VGADEVLLTIPAGEAPPVSAGEGAAGIRRLALEVATPLRDAFG